MRILGLDLGQRKSAWETLDTQTGEVATGQVGMHDDALRKLLARTQPELVVMEIGPLAARVHDLAVAAGVRVRVADTTQDAWRWKNVKRKTDTDDAQKLVRLAALGQINPVHIPAPAVRERRHLLEYRQALVAEQTRCKNRMRATLLMHGLKLPEGKNGWSATGRAQLAAHTKPLAACGPEELWRGVLRTELEHLQQIEALVAAVTAKLDALAQADRRVAQLRTIPGVGPRTAEVLITVLDEPRRFASRRQVAAYGGLVPRRYQSGQMDRSGRISKRGSTLLRAVLNQAAWIAVRCNPALRAFFLRLGGGHKKRRKQAIVAVMRKLLVVMWAMLRDGTAYQASRLQPQRAKAAA
jgi:transposase